VAVAVGVLVGAPAVGWAATGEYGFDATELGNRRLDVRVVVRQESNFGRGFVRAQW
jgi:hypothetical protein